MNALDITSCTRIALFAGAALTRMTERMQPRHLLPPGLFLSLIMASACADGSPPEVPGTSAATSAQSPATTSAQSHTTPSAPETHWKAQHLATFPVGDEAQAFGIHPGAQEDRARGPNAFTVMPDGRIVISDNEHLRLVTLSAEGRWLSTVDLPDARFISALEALDGNRLVAYHAQEDALLLLDARGQIETRARAGQSLQPFGGLSGIDGQGLAYRGGNAFVRLDAGLIRRGGLEQANLARSHSRTLPDGRAVATRRTKTGPFELVVRTGDGPQSSIQRVAMTAPIAGDLGSATFLGSDKQGRLFVRLEVLNGSHPIQVRRFVAVYDAALTPLDAFEYPLEGVILPEDDIQVDERGTVYVLLPYRDRVELLSFKP